jgi:hypothetical protein
MSIRITSLAAILIIVSVARAIDSDESIDKMPNPGNRLSGIEKRLSELEQRLAAVEAAKQPAAAQPAQDAAAAFLNCYMSFQKAEKFVADGKNDLAKAAYEESIAQLKALQQNAPAWNPAIVAHRLQRAEAMLAQIK